MTRFEACSTFTRVAARVVAEMPTHLVTSKCFNRCCYLHRSLRLLPAGATVAGRDSHPLRKSAFPRRTTDYVLQMRTVYVFLTVSSKLVAITCRHSYTPFRLPASRRSSLFRGYQPRKGGFETISPSPYSVILSCLPSGNGQVDKARPLRALRLQPLEGDATY